MKLQETEKNNSIRAVKLVMQNSSKAVKVSKNKRDNVVKVTKEKNYVKVMRGKN